MYLTNLKKSLAFLLTGIMVLSSASVQVIAAEGNSVSASDSVQNGELNEQISLVNDDAAPRALSDSTIGVSAKKNSTFGDFTCNTSGRNITVIADSGLTNQARGTVTITNKKANAVVLTFRYTVSGDKASVSGAINENSGLYNAVLNAGASISFDFDAGANNADATLYIENISAKAITAGAANINVVYNSAYGSVTGAGVNGTAGQKATVTATAASGSKFLGWTDENNMLLSTSASFSFITSGNDTIKALFANPNGEAYFTSGNYIHSDLNKAAAASSLVVLAADGTLGAGNYTIPSGVTLLIPKDSSNKVYTNIPECIDKESNPYVQPTAYRTLRMADGANITVAGAMCVSGTQHAGGTGAIMGGVYGPVGFVRMNEGSKITVKDSAYLYVWGYIVGSGNVEILKNGTVYESFQSTDWRGGSATSALAIDDKNNVFPITQYYVQNVEVPMTLHAGSFEKGYFCTTVIPVSLLGVKGTEVPYIGTGDSNLFTIDSGYIIKDYDEASDRQVYDVYGSLSMKKIRVSIDAGLLGTTITLDSSKNVLPITNNLTIDVHSGTINITQDVCFLPGSEIVVRDGTVCNLTNGKSVYVYDNAEWGGYVGHQNAKFIPLAYAPGRTVNRTALSDAKIQIDGTINASAGFLYTTKSGAVVTSTGTGRVIMKSGTATNTYQITQNGTDTTNVAIPVVVAKLQNADGTTTNPAKEINPSAGTIYTYTDGKWVAKCRNSTCVAADQNSCSKPLPCKFCSQQIKPGHKYTSAVTTPATCVDEGVLTYTCSVCSDTYTEVISATGAHTYTPAVTTPATCVDEGVLTYSCSTCTDSYTEAIPATGVHTYTSAVTTPAACTAEGVRTYTCTYCPDSYTEAIAATGHTAVTDKAIAATCTADGKTEGSHCSVCSAVIKAQETVPATGHTAVVDKAVAATCTADGKTEGSHCSVCNTVIKAQETVKAEGHKYTDTVTTPATCISDGVRTFKCTACEHTYTEKIAKKTEHSYKKITVEPTCEENGFTVYICDCGDMHIYDYLEKTDHNDSDGDNYCDYCDELCKLDDTGSDCLHICHKTGFMGFIWKIINFFGKLFGTNPVCECGAAHY